MTESTLVIKAGRVFTGRGEIQESGFVAVQAGRIVDVGREYQGNAADVLEYPDGILLPGLVDLHAHPAAFGESKYGVNPDQEFLTQGVTTVMSQGDAGASNWAGYRDNTIAQSKTRVRLAINLSQLGEVDGRACFEDDADADVAACVAAIDSDTENFIWGIAINVSRVACLADPQEVMRRGLEVASQTNKPILYGMREPADWSIAGQLGQLRPGDVVTYCFRPPTVTIVQNGRVDPAVVEARERGVLFDLGHGWTSFDYTTCDTALGEGFLPDTISTDQYARHLGSSPAHGLPLTVSKLLAAGFPLVHALEKITSRPAAVLGLSAEVGELAAGRVADVCVLHVAAAGDTLMDTQGASRPGDRWEAACVLRAGEVIKK